MLIGDRSRRAERKGRERERESKKRTVLSGDRLLATVRARGERGKGNRRSELDALGGELDESRGKQREGERIEEANRVERGQAPRHGKSQGRERERKSKVRA